MDVSKLKHPDDVKNDSFGSWKHSESHPQIYKAYIEEDGYVQIEKCAEGKWLYIFDSYIVYILQTIHLKDY